MTLDVCSMLEINRKGHWPVGLALSAKIFRLFRLQPGHLGFSFGWSKIWNFAVNLSDMTCINNRKHLQLPDWIDCCDHICCILPTSNFSSVRWRRPLLLVEDLLEDGGGRAAHREGRHGRAARHERVRRLRGQGDNSIETFEWKDVIYRFF